MKNKTRKFTFIFITFILILGVLEGIGYIIKPKISFKNKRYKLCDNCNNLNHDPKLGNWYKPESTSNPRRYCSPQKLCYSAEYSFDKYGRREVPSTQNYKKHILLFGCSYVFGNGLNNDQTLAVILQNKKIARIHNYGLPASGAPLVLRLMETSKVQKEVKEKKGIAFYILPEFHRERQSIHSSLEWRWIYPTYELDSKKNIYFNGFQGESIGTKLYLYKAYNYFKRNSKFLSHFELNFSPHTESQSLLLLAKSIAKAKRIYEQDFDGKFYVVGHPLAPPKEDMLLALRQEGLEYISIPEFKQKKEKYFVCECDGHPNAQANLEIANFLETWMKNNNYSK